MDGISIPPAGLMPLPAITDYLQAPSVAMRPQTRDGQSFANVLQQAMLPPDVDVQFSHHAQTRMKSRGIELDQNAMIRLDEGVKRAQEKGAKGTLILMDGNAFVVNVNTRTVITAMNPAEANGGVFTKIDSTVIMN
ncbi:MAG: TIGR02530 family flagellar biosynthesis protein [bacterium]|jgi:flagellar operon protein